MLFPIPKKSARRAGAFFLVLCLLGAFVFAPGACRALESDVSVERIFGSTRYQTAMLCAERAAAVSGEAGTDSVIVASGLDFADALGGSYLASAKGAPILLSKNGSNNGELWSYIKDNLSPGGTVYILGGEMAVPASLEEGLSDFSVKRLFGKDRYATNVSILNECGLTGDELLVCTGTGFADSLSASATGKPILLVNSQKGALTDGQRTYLSGAGFERITVLGGEGAVGRGLAEELSAYAPVTRIGGADRYETSVLVAEAYFDSPEGIVLACGQNYPDGLCGGLLANRLGHPVILAEDRHADRARSYVLERDIFSGFVLGGTGLISDATVEYIFSREQDPQRIVYGYSAMGKELEAYRFGRGENVFVLTFCLHGFEDAYDRDGAALVHVAERLMEEIPEWSCEDWSIYVLPCCNPDGLHDGHTNDGQGRCTVGSFLSDGTLTLDRGVDMNRNFPTGWRQVTTDRNYSGPEPLSCPESKALGEFIANVKGAELNYLVDVHGWYWETLTSDGEYGTLSSAFRRQFPYNAWSRITTRSGYFATYAATLGYTSCLFEIPSTEYSLEDFVAGTYTDRFISVIKDLVDG